jgi:hypothetical protein
MRKRPLLQFSLRMALVGLTALCVALGILSARVARQRAAVEAITQAGGRVSYGHKFLVGPREYAREETRVPKWLSDFVGDDWFYSVEGVTLCSEGCNDEMLKNLAALPHVKRLALWPWADSSMIGPNGGSITQPYPPPAGVTDDGLRLLRNHPSLEHVSLLGNRVTDGAIEHLTQIPRLRSIDPDKDMSGDAYRSLMAAISARESQR